MYTFIEYGYSSTPYKRSNMDNLGIIIHIFSIKTYFVTRLIEMILMRGHNICFH